MRQRALTAASRPITDPQKQMKSTLMGASRTDWQQEAWDLYECVGELSYYVSWRANSCSRVRLIASDIDPETGLPTGGLETDDKGKIVNPEAQRVAEWVKTIADGPLGQEAMIKRATECLSVPGEVYLAVLVVTDPITAQAAVRWYVLNRDEIKTRSGETAEIELPDGTKHQYNPSLDSLIHIWFPRPRRAKEPTSPVRACLEPLREIVRTSKKIKHAAKSRMMNNGVLFVPSQMSLPAAQAPVPEGMADVPGAEIPIAEITGVPAADQLATLLYQASVASMEDEDNQTAFIPLIATVAAEHLDKVQHIKFGNDVTDVEIKTRTDAIARLAMGLDVSPERLLGMSKGNHWSAWEIGDNDVQLHIKPVMALICSAIYNDLLSVMLRRENIDPSKYTLWFDASQLTADPDLTDEAEFAHEAGAITHATLRRILNVGEDSGYDLASLDGVKEWVRDVLTKDPTQFRELLPVLALDITELDAIDFPEPVAIGSGGDPQKEPAEDSSGAESKQEPKTEDNSQDDSAAARVTGRAEYIMAERMLLGRAMELAGRRRVKVYDTAQKARLEGVLPQDYHRFMEPVAAAQIPKLIDGWDTILNDEVMATMGIDTTELRETVLRLIHHELTQPVIDGDVAV